MANRQQTQRMLDLTCAMWDDPRVYHYQDNILPKDAGLSIFLAGPSSREDVLEFKWRPAAVYYLRKFGFAGSIFVPEPRENDWKFKKNFPTSIVSWERERLLSVTQAMFWIPRHQTQLPGRVTNTELGFLAGMAFADPLRYKPRLVWGYPEDAWKMKSELHWVGELLNLEPFHDLGCMCQHVATTL